MGTSQERMAPARSRRAPEGPDLGSGTAIALTGLIRWPTWKLPLWVGAIVVSIVGGFLVGGPGVGLAAGALVGVLLIYLGGADAAARGASATRPTRRCAGACWSW